MREEHLFGGAFLVADILSMSIVAYYTIFEKALKFMYLVKCSCMVKKQATENKRILIDTKLCILRFVRPVMIRFKLFEVVPKKFLVRFMALTCYNLSYIAHYIIFLTILFGKINLAKRAKHKQINAI